MRRQPVNREVMDEEDGESGPETRRLPISLMIAGYETPAPGSRAIRRVVMRLIFPSAVAVEQIPWKSKEALVVRLD